jgi:hypothetical protein
VYCAVKRHDEDYRAFVARGNQQWHWGDTEKAAFDQLKSSISTDCVAYFDKSMETEVVVDVSPIGIGCRSGTV